jgi:hypothetical protein
MPEPAATLLELVNNRDVTHLGPRLQPHIGFYVNRPALVAGTLAHTFCAGLSASRERRQCYSRR